MPVPEETNQEIKRDFDDVEITDEELALAEDAINKAYEKDVQLNFIQFFHLKFPYVYEDFAAIHALCSAKGFELHKPVKQDTDECVVSIDTLKHIFGHTAKFIYHVTNQDMEHFRLQLLKHYNITFCRCGCTALMMEVGRMARFSVGWGKIQDDAANKVCEEKNIPQINNRKCRRQLRTIEYLRELEERNSEALNLSKIRRANSFDERRHPPSSTAKIAEETVSSNVDEVDSSQIMSTTTEGDEETMSGFTIDSQAIVD